MNRKELFSRDDAVFMLDGSIEGSVWRGNKVEGLQHF